MALRRDQRTTGAWGRDSATPMAAGMPQPMPRRECRRRNRRVIAKERPEAVRRGVGLVVTMASSAEDGDRVVQGLRSTGETAAAARASSSSRAREAALRWRAAWPRRGAGLLSGRHGLSWASRSREASSWARPGGWRGVDVLAGCQGSIVEMNDAQLGGTGSRSEGSSQREEVATTENSTSCSSSVRGWRGRGGGLVPANYRCPGDGRWETR
jgi:hypothetical protein